MTFTPGLIANTTIIGSRAAEFEEWVRSVLVPTDDAADLPGRWQVMRTDGRSDGAVTFLFLFEGDDLEAWDMEKALAAKYGPERASAEVADLTAMMAGEQEVWRLTPITEPVQRASGPSRSGRETREGDRSSTA